MLHTLAAPIFTHVGRRSSNNYLAKVFHILGEVELVFGIWTLIFLVSLGLSQGFAAPLAMIRSLSFIEPLFVGAIVVVASTAPIVDTASRIIRTASSILPIPKRAAMLTATLILGPLLGSLITEVAAMTVTALVINETCFSENTPQRLRYAILATLFVNISIGGVLTHFAAPPVVMVASRWGWTTGHMFLTFGVRAIAAILLNVVLLNFLFRRHLLSAKPEFSPNTSSKQNFTPAWISFIHFATLGLLVFAAHNPALIAIVLGGFVSFTVATKKYQQRLQIRQGLLVGIFLAGIVILSHPQTWWVAPLIEALNPHQLLFGSAVLTAVMDNASITLLAAQVPGLSPGLQYAVVAGALAGGGMTVIANAPNPAGYMILRDRFDEGAVSTLALAAAAILPTLVALFIFSLGI